MKRSIESMIVATVVLLFAFATSVPAQKLPGVTVKPGAAASTVNHAEGRVYLPTSSIVQPGSAGKTVHTNVEVFVPEGFQPDQVAPPFSGYGFNTPASLACRYRIPNTSIVVAGCNPNVLTATPSGGSQTIAIVDAFDDPWIGDDLYTFSLQFSIPFSPSQFEVVYATGVEPPFDLTGGWELEESLDVEYAHAMAPSAKIILVEAASNDYSDMFYAVQVASAEVQCGSTYCASGGSGMGEVSMSWGSGEFSGETDYDSYFTTPNVVYFAAAGDSPGVSYPCASTNVVCVGGTSLSRNPSTLKLSAEGTWELAGGGQSIYESIPSYQSMTTGITSALGSFSNLGINTSYRGVPDVALAANPYTGMWVFDSFEFALLGYIPTTPPDAGGWWIVGGTSASTPTFAGIVNLAGNFYASSVAELTTMYNNSPANVGNDVAFNDIIAGTGVCGPFMGYSAENGWDLCTGLGGPWTLAGK